MSKNESIGSSRWRDIAQLALKFSLEMSGVPGVGTGVDLLATLAGLQAEQAKVLSAIKADTGLLRLAPLRTATTHISEAARLGPGSSRYRHHCDLAITYLFEARSLAGSLQEQSFVELQLAAIFALLDQSDDARHWISVCVQSSTVALDSLVEGTQGRALQAAADDQIELIDARGPTDITVPFGVRDIAVAWAAVFSVAGRRAMQKEKRSRVRSLLEYLQFYNTALNWYRAFHASKDPVDLGLYWRRDQFGTHRVVLTQVDDDRARGLRPVGLTESLAPPRSD